MSVSARSPQPAPPRAGSPRAELNVLALIDHLALGGAEMILGQFAAAAPRAGIRLHVACMKDGDGNPAAEALRKAGIEPVNLELDGRPGWRHLRVTRRHIRSVEPDLVHTHLGTSSLIGGLAARSQGIPAISTIHAIQQRHVGIARAKDAVFKLVERCCAARVIVVSDSARRAYLEHSHGMDRRVVRIYNGIDLEVMAGSGASVRRELGIAPDDLLVGMVSALRPEKGHDIAIDAFAQVRTHFPRARLLIAGQGASREEIAQRAAPLGESVILAGRRTDVARVFDALDVCIHPSHMDAFPTTLLEALAASVPVLATAVGGIPEIIEDGRTGVLLSAPPSAPAFADALTALLADQPRRQALAEAGARAYVERFTTGPWVESTRSLYDAVLEEARASRKRAGRPSPR